MTNKLKEQLVKKSHRRYNLHSVQDIEQKNALKNKIYMLQSVSTCEKANSLYSYDQMPISLCNTVQIVQQNKNKRNRHVQVCSLNSRLNSLEFLPSLNFRKLKVALNPLLRIFKLEKRYTLCMLITMR